VKQPQILEVKPHTVTEDTRDEVAGMSAHGLSPTEIAAILKVDPRELKVLYQDELAHGLALATAKVGGTLYKKAKLGDTKAAIFWLQARAGWRTGAQAPTSPSPEPGQTKTDVVGRILGMLTPAQLVQAVAADTPPVVSEMPPSTQRH
jgi:hypothetical protein